MITPTVLNLSITKITYANITKLIGKKHLRCILTVSKGLHFQWVLQEKE